MNAAATTCQPKKRVGPGSTMAPNGPLGNRNDTMAVETLARPRALHVSSVQRTTLNGEHQPDSGNRRGDTTPAILVIPLESVDAAYHAWIMAETQLQPS